MIEGYSIITQSGKHCSWCDKAATLLDKAGVKYHLRPLSLSQLRIEAGRANMTTIPIIYHGVKLVGGYDDLLKYMEKN